MSEKSSIMEAMKVGILQRIQEEQGYNAVDPRTYSELNIFEALNFEDVSDEEAAALDLK
tara:strand:- start:306 stop:482 length:177 start_codon:yes stop_codon:yes gene_type:complete